jgi:hypothetical protein
MLRAKGFGNAKIPSVDTPAGPQPYQGNVPHNLPELTDDQLGFHLGLLSEWNNYVQQQLAESDVHLQKVKAILEHVEAKLRIAYTRDEEDKKRSNPERDDMMTADRRYIEANSHVIYWETLFTHIKAIANSADQAYSAVSRRITQRGQEIDRNNRSGSLNGHSNIPAGPLFGRRS